MNHPILANRALGILSAYIDQRTDITTWFIPSNVCFSLPFLVISKNKHLEMFDFGFTSEIILKKIKEQKQPNTGIVLVNHFGMSWTQEEVQSLSPYFNSVIIDACLSPPETHLPKSCNSDLLIFSTGKGKFVDLGYGAIGYCKVPLTIQPSSHPSQIEIHRRYEWLESFWKMALAGGSVVDYSEVRKLPWIDDGAEKLTNGESYFSQVVQQSSLEWNHRNTLNEIYQAIIGPDLAWNSKANLWRYHLWVDKPEIVINALFDNGLFASRHYPNGAKRLGVSGSFESAELLENHIINLFNSTQVNSDFAEKCSQVVSRLLSSGKVKPASRKPIF